MYDASTLLLETVRIERGVPIHLPYHQQRLNRTQRALFPTYSSVDLAKEIVPPENDGIWRCRILYDNRLRSVTYHPYTPRNVRRLACIEVAFDYSYKYADRTRFDALLRKYPDADDILMTKGGYLTDTTIANIAFFDGNRWLTPDTPLLEGTTRARLIETGKLHPAPIRVTDIPAFRQVALMNAMIGFKIVSDIVIDIKDKNRGYEV